jgi:hypothetical protein
MAYKAEGAHHESAAQVVGHVFWMVFKMGGSEWLPGGPWGGGAADVYGGWLYMCMCMCMCMSGVYLSIYIHVCVCA